MKNTIRLSVVVCTWNRPVLLQSCLDALEHQTLPKDQYEVLIVFSHPCESTLAGFRPDPPYRMTCRIVVEDVAGISRARNRGWQEAAGEYIAYIDDDARADPDWAGRILGHFTSVSPRPIAVGGDVLPFLTKKPPFWFSGELETFSFGGNPRFLSPSQARYGFIGTNMAFTREILAESGGFSLSLGMVGPVLNLGEETELFVRIGRKHPGRFWYDPNLRVRHCVADRHLHLRIRCSRSFISGKALAGIDAAWLKKVPLWKKILNLFRLFLALPYRIFRFRRPIMTELVMFLQDLSERTGYLFFG